jgi:hypothetical protein
MNELAYAGADKRGPTAEHLVQHHPQRVDIGLLIYPPSAATLLR